MRRRKRWKEGYEKNMRVRHFLSSKENKGETLRKEGIGKIKATK